MSLAHIDSFNAGIDNIGRRVGRRSYSYVPEVSKFVNHEDRAPALRALFLNPGPITAKSVGPYGAFAQTFAMYLDGSESTRRKLFTAWLGTEAAKTLAHNYPETFKDIVGSMALMRSPQIMTTWLESPLARELAKAKPDQFNAVTNEISTKVHNISMYEPSLQSMMGIMEGFVNAGERISLLRLNPDVFVGKFTHFVSWLGLSAAVYGPTVYDGSPNDARRLGDLVGKAETIVDTAVERGEISEARAKAFMDVMRRALPPVISRAPNRPEEVRAGAANHKRLAA